MSDGIWIAIIAGLLASSPGIFALFSQRRKAKADVADTFQEIAGRAALDLKTALDEIKRLREEVKGLSARVTILESEKSELEKERNKLIERVECLEKENLELRETVAELQKLQGVYPRGDDHV